MTHTITRDKLISLLEEYLEPGEIINCNLTYYSFQNPLAILTYDLNVRLIIEDDVETGDRYYSLKQA